jgi:hypothetical protein
MTWVVQGPSAIWDLFSLLPASGTDLKSWKGLYSGPSPILKKPCKNHVFSFDPHILRSVHQVWDECN